MSDKPISPLRQRMIDDTTARRFREKVQKAYVRTFAAFLGRSPDTATSEDLRRFQLHMAAVFMADSQVPWGVNALGGAVTEPACKSKPSWYLQVRDDKMIPFPAQQFMAKRAGATIVEVPGSHAIYVSNPNAVAALIEQAASGVK